MSGPPHDSPPQPYAPPAQRASAEADSPPSTPADQLAPAARVGPGGAIPTRPAYRGPARPLSPAAQPYGPLPGVPVRPAGAQTPAYGLPYGTGRPGHGLPYGTAEPRDGQPYGPAEPGHGQPYPPSFGAAFGSSGHAYAPHDVAERVVRVPDRRGAGGEPLRRPGKALLPYVADRRAIELYVAPRTRPAVRLVPPGGRLAAALLDLVLALATLGIGWLLWAAFTWSRGQSPGKQLLGHVVADAVTGVPLPWERMVRRDVVLRGLLLAVANAVTFGIAGILDCCLVFGGERRTLHDRMAGSIVRYR